MTDTLAGPRDIERAVTTIGAHISNDPHLHADAWEGPTPIALLAIMEGALYFAADLSRHITSPHRVVPYNPHTQSLVEILAQSNALHPTAFLVVDTMIETGMTMSLVVDRIRSIYGKGVLIRTAGLLVRMGNPSLFDLVNYAGVAVAQSDGFLYGYGLDDLKGRNRNLTSIFATGMQMSNVTPFRSRDQRR